MRHILIASALARCLPPAAAVPPPPSIPTRPRRRWPTTPGPRRTTADVQSFRINLWENIKANNRCGGCHNATGQTPRFARNDDVNLAYAEANTIVNLTQPDQSPLVLKVAGGHNCWLSSNSACADILTTWIRNWAGLRLPAVARRSSCRPRSTSTWAPARPSPTRPPWRWCQLRNTIWPLVRGARQLRALPFPDGRPRRSRRSSPAPT